MKNFYITSPIYYVNDSPHIGHAYTNLACDVLARYKRLMGYNVKFLTGTDEHGQKIEKAALAKNIDPQKFTDEVSIRFRNLAQIMNISNDDFIRTSEDRHKKAVTAFWEKLKANNHIYLSKYCGWYSVRDEAFFQEAELIDGKAPTGAPVEWIEESSYFFNLSKWQDKLLEFYEQNPEFIYPQSRKNEIINFVKSGLTDLSISRTSFKWGIKVPGDEQHVIYVWLDALTNYISALGYPDLNSEDMKNFWPCDAHVVGKDITRFHAIYWPAFLMAADLPLPKQIIAHGWWTNEGQKISKSLGNVIDPLSLIEQYGLDQTRYFMMKEIMFGSDGNFSAESMVRRINSELANTIGNLAQRTLTMLQKFFEGKIPNIKKEELDKDLVKLLDVTIKNYHQEIDKLNFSGALEIVIELGFAANKFIDDKAPWNLAKTDMEELAKVIYVLLEANRVIAYLLQIFMPDSANKLLDQLLVEKRNFSDINHSLVAGTVLPAPQVIFPRYS